MKIQIDRNIKTIPTDFSWQFGIGNDHAFQMLRTDVCEHVKLAHDELGIQYIRFHGIFDDDMLVIQRFSDNPWFSKISGAKDIQEISFRQVANVFDNVLKCGMKPFVELSFMPSAIASGKAEGLRYKNNITMPKKMELWCDLIERFILFLLERYGQEEVRSWYFEVWNEPDLGVFFKGSKEDYFKLYEASAKTIKHIDPQLRVGGPSTSACRWVGEFKEYCEKNSIPYDFLTTHHYPGDGFGNAFSLKDVFGFMKLIRECGKQGIPLGEVMTLFFYHPEGCKQWPKGILRQMDEQARLEAGDKELFMTEWNSMATYCAPIHDEKFSAAFVVKTVMDLKGVMDGYMFWCCSDIFEESFILGKPFHGSFGIVNNDGIPKPNFWGFKLLSQLYPNRLDLPTTHDDVEYAVFVDGDKTQVLLYTQNFDVDQNDIYQIELTVNCTASSVTKQVIDDTHCNPKAEWIRLGKPDLLTPGQVADIKEKTHLAAEPQEFVSENSTTGISLTMSTNDVVLLTLE